MFGALACSAIPGRPSGDAYASQLKQNDVARERLVFGMSREEAARIMGTTPMVPPWANPRGLGPRIVGNPFDILELEARNGDRYEVHRYAVGLTGEHRCPFVRGEAEFEPLIFFEGVLVGWRWSYLASAMQRRVSNDERRFGFGAFCGAEAAEAGP